MASKNGTEGRVYGGDANLIHIADGNRRNIGRWIAQNLDAIMRQDAVLDERRTAEQAESQDLCPGCYMIAGFNMLVSLAESNGQSLEELGRTMAQAFAKLAGDKTYNPEEIDVILDND